MNLIIIVVHSQLEGIVELVNSRVVLRCTGHLNKDPHTANLIQQRSRDKGVNLHTREKYALTGDDWIIESLGIRLLHYRTSEVVLK